MKNSEQKEKLNLIAKDVLSKSIECMVLPNVESLLGKKVKFYKETEMLDWIVQRIMNDLDSFNRYKEQILAKDEMFFEDGKAEGVR